MRPPSFGADVSVGGAYSECAGDVGDDLDMMINALALRIVVAAQRPGVLASLVMPDQSVEDGVANIEGEREGGLVIACGGAVLGEFFPALDEPLVVQLQDLAAMPVVLADDVDVEGS